MIRYKKKSIHLHDIAKNRPGTPFFRCSSLFYRETKSAFQSVDNQKVVACLNKPGRLRAVVLLFCVGSKENKLRLIECACNFALFPGFFKLVVRKRGFQTEKTSWWKKPETSSRQIQKADKNRASR